MHGSSTVQWSFGQKTLHKISLYNILHLEEENLSIMDAEVIHGIRMSFVQGSVLFSCPECPLSEASPYYNYVQSLVLSQKEADEEESMEVDRQGPDDDATDFLRTKAPSKAAGKKKKKSSKTKKKGHH